MSCLTLAIPGLLWPRPILRDTVFDLRLPAFETLLGRARRINRPALNPAGWWGEGFSLPCPLPAAKLRLLALGKPSYDATWPCDATWLCADPVHVGLDAQGVTLDDPARLQLDSAEAAALCATLGPLMAGFGELHCNAPDAWHLKLKPGLATALPPLAGELADLLGRSGSALLPQGENGRPWRRMLNEVQMALHVHPVNQAREAAGRPTVNSLTLWGASQDLAAATTRFTHVFSNDPVQRGLGVHAGLAANRLPATYAAYATYAADATYLAPARHAVVHWPALLGPTRQQDALAWRSALEQLESDWLAPALAALKRGELHSLVLAGFGEAGCMELELTRSARWLFWRRPKAMESLAA
jgi:hypothetical protein